MYGLCDTRGLFVSIVRLASFLAIRLTVDATPHLPLTGVANIAGRYLLAHACSSAAGSASRNRL